MDTIKSVGIVMLQLLKIILLAVFINAPVNYASAEEQLRPLNEAWKQEKSPHMLLYVFQRCSALMMEMAQRADRSAEQEGSEQFSKSMKEGYEAFAIGAGNLITEIKKRKGDEIYKSPVEPLETILKLQKMYFSVMEKNYLSTGNSLSEQTQNDLSLCVSLLRGG